MPTYKIKEKFFSLKQEYNIIKDENDVICYTITGIFFKFWWQISHDGCSKTGEE